MKLKINKNTLKISIIGGIIWGIISSFLSFIGVLGIISVPLFVSYSLLLPNILNMFAFFVLEHIFGVSTSTSSFGTFIIEWFFPGPIIAAGIIIFLTLSIYKQIAKVI